MSPLLSVVVPIYNVEKYLSKCIDSILNQTFQDFELLLIDDGSTDESSNIAKSYAEKFDKVRCILQENQGQGGARNTGIANALGKYISFIDSDDYIDKEMYNEMISYMQKSDLDICICDYERVNEKGYVTEVHSENLVEGKIYTPDIDKDIFLIDPSPCNKIFKRDLIEENEIKFPIKVWFEDFRTVMKFQTLTSRIGYIRKSFYKYYTRESSTMNTPNLEKQIEILEAMEDLLNFYKKKDLFDHYYSELEFLCFQHVYVYGINRVIRIDSKSDLIKKFKDFTKYNFPNFKDTKYMNRLTKKEKFFYFLIDHNLYFVISWMDKCLKGVRKWKKS